MNVVIVGGGITGLSAAWFCHREHPDAKIVLLEKQSRLGGWLRSSTEGGYFFERGPRTFQMGRSPLLLEMIRELKLEILIAKEQKRYLWHRGKLRSLGSFLPKIWPRLIREIFIKQSNIDDESIYDFACRRFGRKMAETFFDPLTLGIYAGDIRKLSIRACFPMFYEWERKKGSVMRGMFSAPKKEKGLFSLKNGIESLIHELERRIPMKVVLNTEVTAIGNDHVVANGQIWNGDRIISAVPPRLPKKSIWVVHLAFEEDVLKKKGFGYLVPTKEKENLLGVVFDSSIFPQQNKGKETRLTAMLRSEEKEPLQAALSALERHLRINAKPVYSAVHFAEDAIPQFEVGCTYPHGISVEACVERGRSLSQ